MRFNIFEGGRRIAIAIAMAASAITVWSLIEGSPRFALHYQVPDFGVSPIANPGGECSYPSLEKTLTRNRPDGLTYYVDICFLASEAMDGRILIPYEQAGDSVRMNERYNEDVLAYAQRITNQFKIPTEEMESIQYLYYKNRVIEFAKGIGYLLAGLGLFWGFVHLLGWIVRGFLGIPTGQDIRPEQTPVAQ